MVATASVDGTVKMWRPLMVSYLPLLGPISSWGHHVWGGAVCVCACVCLYTLSVDLCTVCVRPVLVESTDFKASHSTYGPSSLELVALLGISGQVYAS